METGTYPDVLKTTCVTSISYSGNPCNISNHRPISDLSILNVIIKFLSSFISINCENEIAISKKFDFTKELFA